MRKLKLPNETQEKEICKIILSGKNLHKEVSQYLKDNKLTIKTLDYSYNPKVLIDKLIDKYDLLKTNHIPYRDCPYDYTQEEFDVLVGGLLGDSWIGFQSGTTLPCGSFTHKLEHKEYVEYKYNLLKRRCSCIITTAKYDKRSNKKYQQVCCRIASSKKLIPIYEAFYPDGKKVIPEELINKLTPLGIAIWYMDDGGTDGSRYKFSVDCFTENDIEKLQKMLKDKFGIETTRTINHNKVIHVRGSSKIKFKNLIEPYICDCMKYKLLVYKSKNGKRTKCEL